MGSYAEIPGTATAMHVTPSLSSAMPKNLSFPMVNSQFFYIRFCYKYLTLQSECFFDSIDFGMAKCLAFYELIIII
jgi:hypothetical protein